MATAPAEHIDPSMPSQQERELAAQSSQKLAAIFAKKPINQPIEISLGDGVTLTVPFSVIQLLLQILSQMAAGNAVTLIPIHSCLTTQQAADLLNVSRPYLIKLLEKGEIPYEKVGTHRRVKAEDLLKYQLKNDKAKKLALDELIKQAQELDLGY